MSEIAGLIFSGPGFVQDEDGMGQMGNIGLGMMW